MASENEVILALGFAAICDTEMRKAKKKSLAEKVAATENTIRVLREFNEGISSRTIYHHLESEIQVPESENEWKMVGEEFWAKWNFPLCLGAMDGKHIRIKSPSHSGATYRIYKGFFSIVLLALVEANLNFCMLMLALTDELAMEEFGEI
ncbi:DDE Tnp4 domain-containing protein [Trichonephila clavipes]|nr:DDE Tnp4 domain-containing protein [Trichonephila clavipes]